MSNDTSACKVDPESVRDAKTALFAQFARVGKALSCETRIEMLELLQQGELSVEVIAHALRQSVPNTSQHLHSLYQTGLVLKRKVGNNVFYRLSNMSVALLVNTLQDVSRLLIADVDVLLGRFSSDADIEGRSVAQVVHDAEMGKRQIVDVRSGMEYRAAHLSGAISIPAEELAQRATELDAELPVVLFGRGPHCILAHATSIALRGRGFQVTRLIARITDSALQDPRILVTPEAIAR